jgi:threonine dehydrogenase-like Zn-dependent dehydrogenase
LNSLPAVLGHENVSVVDTVGPDAREWKVGQRVCVEPSLSCVPRGIDPPCRQCQAGQFCLCEHFRDGAIAPGIMIGTNRQTGGSWAPYFVAHKSQLHAVPDDLSDEQAVLVDPIAGSLHGVLRRPPRDGERVLILGGGIIGLACLASVRALSPTADCVIVVRHQHQAEMAARLGASHVIRWSRSQSTAERYEEIARLVGGRRVAGPFGNQLLLGGFDMVYDCIGSGTSLTDAMKFVRPRGTVVELGTSQITRVDTTPLWLAEVQLLGSYGRQIEQFDNRSRHTYRIVFEMIQTGRISTEGLLTHTFPVRAYRRAFETLTNRGANRVIKAAFRHETIPSDTPNGGTV